MIRLSLGEVKVLLCTHSGSVETKAHMVFTSQLVGALSSGAGFAGLMLNQVIFQDEFTSLI